MKRIVLLIFFTIFFIEIQFPHSQGVHQQMAKEAYKLLKYHLGYDLPDMVNHIDKSGQIGQPWHDNTLGCGAYREDEEDIVFPEYNDPFKWYNSITHFWDADDSDKVNNFELSLLPSVDTIKVKKYIRLENNFFILGGMDGFGIGISLIGIFEIQASSLFLSECAKAKLFLGYENSSPFLGVGFGNQHKGLGGNGEENKWSILILGWQFHPKDKPAFLEFSIQYPFKEENKKAFNPPLISFSGGIRIF